jgi:coproporphyrinogen III oxidase
MDLMAEQQSLKERARDFFANLQDEICRALEKLDGKATFREDQWQREGGGGGRTRVLEGGAVFEKAGVNFSAVHGSFPETFAATLPVGSGTDFFASGTSLVLHPWNPMVPTVHANFRYLERGSSGWFGGGTDLTPAYPYREDVVHFHQTLKDVCERFDATYYPRFKKWCDDYFTIKYRNEMRGVGGIFFDYLTAEQEGRDLEWLFEFEQAAGRAFLPAYLPIAERRKDEPYTERERHFQLIRRGRYVEFNLVYDRGTKFGLETGGRIESILMSLPAEARWVYDYNPEPNSREAEAWAYFQPQDWLGDEGESGRKGEGVKG